MAGLMGSSWWVVYCSAKKLTAAFPDKCYFFHLKMPFFHLKMLSFGKHHVFFRERTGPSRRLLLRCTSLVVVLMEEILHPPLNTGISTTSTGAGFLPSTVSLKSYLLSSWAKFLLFISYTTIYQFTLLYDYIYYRMID